MCCSRFHRLHRSTVKFTEQITSNNDRFVQNGKLEQHNEHKLIALKAITADLKLYQSEHVMGWEFGLVVIIDLIIIDKDNITLLGLHPFSILHEFSI